MTTANGTFRCFVAVAISTEAKAFLERFMVEARPAFPSYRFAATQNLHITLQFLGDVNRGRILELSAALSPAVHETRRFTVGFGGAGSFPERGAPRILHVTIGEGREALSRLAGAVHGALSPHGFAPDKPFAAHITLGRSRDRGGQSGHGNLSTRPEREAAGMWKTTYSRFAEMQKQPITWEIPEVILMESILSPSGPTYIPRGLIALS